MLVMVVFFFPSEDGIRSHCVTGVQTCALPICNRGHHEFAGGGIFCLFCMVHYFPAFPSVLRSEERRVGKVTTASSAPVLQTHKATSSTLYFDSLTVNAGNGGFLHCIQMDTSVNAANQVVSVGADIAFDADPKFFACLVRFESSSVPTTLPTAYDVYP